jgi:hypothetical protein
LCCHGANAPNGHYFCANQGFPGCGVAGTGTCDTANVSSPSYNLCIGSGTVGGNQFAGEVSCTDFFNWYNISAAVIETFQPLTDNLPVSFWVSLIFIAFFVGIIVSYVVYKVRKTHSYSKTFPESALEVSQRSGDESQNGSEKPLNLITPLSEQV